VPNLGLIRHHQAQVQIVSFLRVALPGSLVVSLQNQDELHATKKTAGQRAAARARAVREGMVPGASDLLVISALLPCPMFVEVKTGKARLSDNQRSFAAHAEQEGCWFVVAAHFDDVRDFMVQREVSLHAY
jgi:hypothetical protein